MQIFRKLLEDLRLAGRHLSIDGKELRSTIPSGKKHTLVRMVNVWVHDLGLSFGQEQVEKKSNEITAIPASRFLRVFDRDSDKEG